MDDDDDWVVVVNDYPLPSGRVETVWTKTDRNIAIFASAVAMLCSVVLLVVTFWTRSASWWIAGATASLAAASVVSMWLASRPVARL